MENKKENKEFTVEEVIGITIKQLQKLPITIDQMDTLGNPIRGCIRNLVGCLNAIKEAEKATEPEGEDEDAPVLELVPAEGDEQ